MYQSPAFHFMCENHLWIGSGAIVVLPLALLLAYIVRRKLRPHIQIAGSPGFEAGELMIFLFVLVLIAAFPVPLATHYGSDADPASWGASLVAFSTFPLWIVLVMTRIPRRGLWWVNAILCLALAALCWTQTADYRYTVQDIRQELEGADLPDALVPGFMIPDNIFVFREMLELALPFLAGIFCVRKRFHLLKYVLGVMLTMAILRVVFYGGLPLSFSGILRHSLQFIFIGYLIFLPCQRTAFERVFGISLRSETPASNKRRRSLGFRAASTTVLALALLTTAFFAYFGHLERRMFQITFSGPPPLPANQGKRNAYVDLKDLFTRNESPRLTYSPPDTTFLSFLDQLDAPIKKAKDVEPYIEALEAARSAEFCHFYEPDRQVIIDFINTRMTTKLLGWRTVLAVESDRPGQAVYDIQTILNTAWLLNTDGILVTNMIGVAVRGIGLDVSKYYLLKFRNDSHSLDLLHQGLFEIAPKARVGICYESIRRNEPGLWPVIPYPSILVPGTVKAYTTTMYRGILFEQLLVGLALERYNLDQGQYPDDLEDLVPDYIDALPVDPFEGLPFEYSLKGDGYVLHCEPLSERGDYDDFEIHSDVSTQEILDGLQL